jgi:cytochrome c-type biogenesis protein CcmH/NrfG
MKHFFLALGLLAALGTSPAAFADGGNSSGSEAAAPKDADYQAGMAAVAKRNWREVVVRMTAYAGRNPQDANGWNELGHAHRQLGELDVALVEYGKALKIDPRHRGAHEYLGETYLQMGDVARAEQELKALDSICLLPCEQYTDLKGAIAQYRRGKTAQAK